MTEETQQPETPVQNEAQTSSPDVSKLRDNKKEKCRPMTKVIIRRLPPTMTSDQLMEQISPLPEHDYFYFVKADMSLGQYAFSRAYINFTDQQDIFTFKEKFDNYVFVDSKGTEYPAVVEFSPFQRLPKKRVGKKKDLKCGTIESDSYYISFLESRNNQEADSTNAQPKTEYSYQPADNTLKKVTTTPLLEYLKQRKQEKQRLRDEKREERRRRELERRRIKDDPIISKVLKNPDLDKDTNKDNKENKDDRDKVSPKDLKNRNKRDEKLREKVPRDRDLKPLTKAYRERMDDRNKDRDIKHQRRHEDKKLYGRRDDRDLFKEDKKIDIRDNNKNYDIKDDFKESKERRIEEKKVTCIMKENQNITQESTEDGLISSSTSKGLMEFVNEKNDGKNNGNIKLIENEQDIEYISDQTKDTETSIRAEKDASEKSRSIEHINREIGINNESEEIKESSKVVKRRSSLESGGEGGTGDNNCLRRHKSLDGDGQSNLQKSESEDKEKDKKDPRLERRIRNKDRPAMEIYRPGMGKFSKQRLEREKSNNDDRASLSQSPTPNATTTSSTVSKTAKSGSEVRSMTFKRSVSRDIS
ncbi:PREDICTED: regulator of nonsense transcripts 3B isoform X2 [Polistes dominula]|uniref:Regulator of nonsense transcripts 3B isoform X2 n=1 Tax=Polistes dominula TaxID=743375 RepID=A0ABM1I1T0_POLDO|nr:PREDICTED: regulator of nonsense transcripts 3B isoform X2 [Polistes dominula]